VYVDSDAALRRLVRRLQTKAAIAVDTESNSLFAYRERLCLIQISTRSADYVVDPLAEIDIALLAPVFADPAILKVFHDAEYDILTLKRAGPFEFAGLFDTKVAAASLGRSAVGLAALLRELFAVELDKRCQRSDWGDRPLTGAQLEYARLDTHYLLELADHFRRQLHEAKPLHLLEVASECRRIEQLVPEERVFDPEGWVRIRGAERLSPRARRVMRELFITRDELARHRDTPPFKIFGNETLVEMAKAQPSSRQQLRAVTGMSTKLTERFGEPILAALERARRLKDIDAMPPAAGNDELLPLTSAQRTRYERVRQWRRDLALARQTDASLILPRQLMLALVKLKPPGDLDALAATGVLEPWRVHHYGEALLAALR
jgi:ribonuclease D